MTDAANESHNERKSADGEERMDDAILTSADDLEALFEDEGDDLVAATGGSKPDPTGNPK
jgi:hypothetical protein